MRAFTVNELIHELRKQAPNAPVILAIVGDRSSVGEYRLAGLAERKEALEFADINSRDVFDEDGLGEPPEFTYEVGTAGNDVLLVARQRLRDEHPNLWDVVRDDRPQ